MYGTTNSRIHHLLPGLIEYTAPQTTQKARGLHWTAYQSPSHEDFYDKGKQCHFAFSFYVVCGLHLRDRRFCLRYVKLLQILAAFNLNNSLLFSRQFRHLKFSLCISKVCAIIPMILDKSVHKIYRSIKIHQTDYCTKFHDRYVRAIFCEKIKLGRNQMIRVK